MATEGNARICDITLEQLTQLKAVEPSFDKWTSMKYRPCRITTTDGRIFDRVYVQELSDLEKGWGIPEVTLRQAPLRIEHIKQIESSPLRLPARLANRLYDAGESGMGYFVFTIQLKDGRRLPYVTGNAVDFPNWPPGVIPEMIDDFAKGYEEKFRHRHPTKFEQSADIIWCAYRVPATE